MSEAEMEGGRRRFKEKLYLLKKETTDAVLEVWQRPSWIETPGNLMSVRLPVRRHLSGNNQPGASPHSSPGQANRS